VFHTKDGIPQKKNCQTSLHAGFIYIYQSVNASRYNQRIFFRSQDKNESADARFLYAAQNIHAVHQEGKKFLNYKAFFAA
jgi:hypothetical protein